MEKLQKQISEKDNAVLELQSKLDEMKLNEQKINIAAEVGLPSILSLRIQGATPEEMKADAQKILEGLPIKQAPIPTTSPGHKAVPTEKSVAEQLSDLGL